MNDGKHTLLLVLGALLIGAIGFFVGIHARGRFLATSLQRAPMMGYRMGPGMARHMWGGKMGFGRNGAAGEITTINGKTITLKYSDGTTKDITLDDSAVVYTMVKGAAADLKVGETVTIGGGDFWNGTQTVFVKPQ